jgi:archaellum component FlaC
MVLFDRGENTTMNDPKRFEELEQHVNNLELETRQNLTMVIGQNWRTEENLRLFRSEANTRLTRIDDRVTEAHRELGELQITVKAVKDDIASIKTTQEQILKLLQQKP